MKFSAADLAAIRARATSARAASFRPEDVLFERQLAAFNDPSDHRAVVCSRRAGKSVLSCVELLASAMRNPDTDSIYVGLTLQQAKDIVWRDLLKYNKQFRLGGDPNATTSSITFANGSKVQLRGADSREDIEWFRGHKFALCVIDECGAIGAHLRELVEDAIGPTMLDYGGRLLLLGTPGYVEAGYWFEATHGKIEDYTVHSWTVRDNHPLREALARKGKSLDVWLDRQCRQLGGPASPKWQREYEGKWARDTSSLVFAGFDPERSTYTVLPTGPREIVIGVDLGSSDATSISVCAWYPQSGPELYLIDEWVAKRAEDTTLNIDTIENKLVSFVNEYKPRIPPVIDEGGLGRMVADTIRDRRRVNVQAADKGAGSVLDGVEHMNADLASGRLKLPPRSRAAQDCGIVVWDRAAALRGERKIAKVPHSDALDSLRYAYSVARHFAFKPPPTPKSDRDAELDALFAEARSKRDKPYYERFRSR